MCASARSCRTARCSLVTSCASKANVIAAVAATTAAIAQQRRRCHRRRVRAAAGRHRSRSGAGPRLRRWSMPTGRPTAQPMRWYAIATTPRSRRSPRAMSRPGLAEADHVITSRYVADGCHAAPIEPRAVVAQWEGNKVTIWTSTQVPFDARAGVCETLGLPANRVRIIVPHLGGGFGGKCGFHYEAHIAALARAAKRPVRLVFSPARGVPRPGPPPRGHDHRHHHRRAQRRHDHRPQGVDRHRQRRLHRRQRLLPATGGDARVGPVPHPQPARRSPPRLHQPAAVGLGARPNRAAGVLGARVAHRRGRRGDRHGPGRLPPQERRRHRRR